MRIGENMNKGFTLVEIMATIVILAVVLLIAVPIYNGVREGINENIYDSKIKEVLAKGESYASENHASVFDIKTLIEAGEISADNETGVYKDPRTGRDMRCDILNALYKENHYEISITESEVCYSKEELENLYGMVELKVYSEENVEIKKLEDTEWIRESKVKVRYEFKEEYKGYENSIESVIWTGEEVKSCQKENVADCFEYRIETSEIKNVVVSLELTINLDGVLIRNQVQKNILVDLQNPSVIDGSVNVDNEVSTNNERRVEFELSDGSGSGIRSYSIVKNKSCSGDEYEQNKQSASEGIQSTYLGNGDYYICVEDKVGNKSSERDLDEERNQIHVSGVDTSKPVISSFTIKSRKSGYNALETSLTISAKDDGGTSNLEMCVSNTGYLKGCSWEKYASSKNWTLTGSLDGKERTVYLSIRDSAGNIVNRSAKYTTYKECSKTSKVYTDSSYGSCSKSCGGGLQYRAYAMKDSYTSKTCSTGKDSKTCNTQSCSIPEYPGVKIGSVVWYQTRAGSTTSTISSGSETFTMPAKKIKTLIFSMEEDGTTQLIPMEAEYKLYVYFYNGKNIDKHISTLNKIAKLYHNPTYSSSSYSLGHTTTPLNNYIYQSYKRFYRYQGDIEFESDHVQKYNALYNMGYTKIGGKYCSSFNSKDTEYWKELTKAYLNKCDTHGAYLAIYKYKWEEGTQETRWYEYFGYVESGKAANSTMSGRDSEGGERVSYIDDAYYSSVDRASNKDIEDSAIYGYVVPVITLKSNVYISGGSGTVSDPYTLGVS